MARKTGLAHLEEQFWNGTPLRDCTWEPPFDGDGVQVSSGLDARGRELPDPVPCAPPVGYRDGPSLADFVQRMIRQEVSRIAEDAAYESFEEAEDFDTGEDDIDPLTPYEQVFDPRSPGGAGGPPPAQAPSAPPSAVAPAAPDSTLT